MASILVEFFKHNTWANLALLDACAGLSDARLDATCAGTYGRLRDTLVHLVAAQERYVEVLTGQRQETQVYGSTGFPGFPRLRESARWSGDALVAAAETAQPETILRGTRNGEAYAIRVFVPLLQAINHATEHRCHVATILTQQGIEPPNLDGWTYGDDPTLA
ncbi:MAG: hypothetical protein NVSMB65_19140 [Chloroflexota bacterium]